MKLAETDLDLGELPEQIIVELRICQILAEQAFTADSMDGVSPGLYMILALIDKNPGQKQSTLASCVKLDRSTLVPLLNQCERKQWIQRKPYEGDGRARAVYLTRQGKAVVRRQADKLAGLEAGVGAHMAFGERDTLLRLLKQFQVAIAAGTPDEAHG